MHILCINMDMCTLPMPYFLQFYEERLKKKPLTLLPFFRFARQLCVQYTVRSEGLE